MLVLESIKVAWAMQYINPSQQNLQATAQFFPAMYFCISPMLSAFVVDTEGRPHDPLQSSC